MKLKHKKNLLVALRNIVLLFCLYVLMVFILRSTVYCSPFDETCRINRDELPPIVAVALPMTILVAFIWEKIADKFDL